MACKLHSRAGQAMTELIVAILAITLVILALTEFVPVFFDNVDLQKEIREEAGLAALKSETGIIESNRKSEFELDIPGEWIDPDSTSGEFSEKQYMPAANLACYEPVRIPNISGVVEELRFANDSGTMEFISGTSVGSTGSVLSKVCGAFVGSGWVDCGIGAADTALFSKSELTVAAVHVKEESSADGLPNVRLTVIVRSAGGSIGY
jgi:hypothetical protein